jgi:hypothetical protein
MRHSASAQWDVGVCLVDCLQWEYVRFGMVDVVSYAGCSVSERVVLDVYELSSFYALLLHSLCITL